MEDETIEEYVLPRNTPSHMKVPVAPPCAVIQAPTLMRQSVRESAGQKALTKAFEPLP